MNRISIVSGLCFVLFASTFSRAEDAPFAKTLDELMPKLSAEKIADRHGAQQSLLRTCLRLGAPGKEKQRLEASQAIAKKLGTNMTAPARVWLLKQLEFIGRAECVDAVAVLLGDKEPSVRDSARRALANNPAETAGARLLAKMQGEQDAKFKAALINSLGFRREADSAKALIAQLASKDQIVAIAAARALGKIASPEATKGLLAAGGKTSGELKRWVGDSCLLCADRLLKQGKSAEAAAIYKQLSQSKDNVPLRLAAVQGLLKATQSGKKPGGK